MVEGNQSTVDMNIFKYISFTNLVLTFWYS